MEPSPRTAVRLPRPGPPASTCRGLRSARPDQREAGEDRQRDEGRLTGVEDADEEAESENAGDQADQVPTGDERQQEQTEIPTPAAINAPRADLGIGGRCRNLCRSRKAEWLVCPWQAAAQTRSFGLSEALAALMSNVQAQRYHPVGVLPLFALAEAWLCADDGC